MLRFRAVRTRGGLRRHGRPALGIELQGLHDPLGAPCVDPGFTVDVMVDGRWIRVLDDGDRAQAERVSAEARREAGLV